MQDERRTTEVRQETTTPETIERRETVSRRNVSTAVLVQRIIYYIGGVIIALLALRLLFQLLGANQGSPFVDFIYSLSGVFVLPFSGIFGEPTYGNSQFETSTFVAMIIYGLITIAIAKLLTIGSANRDA